MSTDLIAPDPLTSPNGVRATELERRRHERPRMRLSVIIPVHNSGDLLSRCLAGLEASARPANEIIVIDDGSTDGSSVVAAAHGARVVEIPGGPRGPAFARNRGAALASGEILVFIDADVVVQIDTLTRVEAVFEREPAVQALFGSYDDNPPAPGVVSRFKNLLQHYVHQHSKREASTFWTGCGAIRKSAFFLAGGFAESYSKPSIEDIELGVRLHQARQPVRLCPEIQVTHLKRWTLSNLWGTDIFARAVPWTRIILREGRLTADLNLTWRSRLSAATIWTVVALLLVGLALRLVGRIEQAQWAGVGATVFLVLSVILNAKLYLFFFRRGSVSFALCACTLHLAYLLYSSAIFAALLTTQALRRMVMRRRPAR